MQSVIVPLALALVLTGVLRLAGGARIGPRIAASSIVISFLAAYALTSGVPPFPPRASTQKVFYVALGSGLAGVVLELARATPLAARVVAAVAALAVAAWLGWPLARSVGGIAYLMWAGAAAWGVVASWRSLPDRDAGLAPAVPLLAAAAGSAAIAYFGATLSAAMYGAALACSLGGFMLWNWPKPRFAVAEPVALGAGVTLAGLVSLLVFYTTASRLALVLLLGVFFAGPAARRVSGRLYREKSASGPVILLLACVPPVLAAVVVAWVLSEPGGSGY